LNSFIISAFGANKRVYTTMYLTAVQGLGSAYSA